MLSCIQLFATPGTAARQASLSFTVSRGLLKLMSTELMMSSNHLILCHPLLLLPSIFYSIRVFPVSWLFHQVAKVLNFSISPSNEYSGLISFRIDWFDLLTVQGTLKSLLQYHSSKESILFKKIRDTKGTFHANVSIIKDKNSMDLTEAEDTKYKSTTLQ